MKSLEKYFNKRSRTLIFFLEKPVQRYSAEYFHKVRLEIKKIKAVFEIINYCLPHFKRKQYSKSYQLVFKQAGRIREIQLEEAMFRKLKLNGSMKEYLSNLKRKQAAEKDRFISIRNKKPADRLKKNNDKIIALIRKMDKKKADEYLKDGRKKIKVLVKKKALKTAEAHEVRKRLKKLYFTIKGLNAERTGDVLKTTDSLQEMLGKWHDDRVMENHLKEAISSGEVNAAEIHKIRKIKSRLSTESKKLFKDINRIMHAPQFLNEIDR